MKSSFDRYLCRECCRLLKLFVTLTQIGERESGSRGTAERIGEMSLIGIGCSLISASLRESFVKVNETIAVTIKVTKGFD